MWRGIKRIVLYGLAALLLFMAAKIALNWDLVQRLFLGGLKVYETTPPSLPENIRRPAILVFSKTNAYRHEEAIPAANHLFAQMAKEHGWGYFQTENGAAFSPQILSRFDAVVFNNVSGDVFTPQQREAFKAFVEQGGGFVGIHAAGDNSHKAWPWYQNSLIGAKFTQHTMEPQFQVATVKVENARHPLVAGLPASWRRTEEWYSFEKSPRSAKDHVLITVDEGSYKPVGMFGKDLRMGDHPMVWWHCEGKGRALYTAFGHQAAAYSELQFRTLLDNATKWALRLEGTECSAPAATVPARENRQ